MSSVALVVSTLEAGGAERAVAVLANGWAKQGRRVTVITFDDGKSDHYALDPAVERVTLDLFWPSRNVLQSIRSSFIRLRRIRREVEKRKPTVVVSFLVPTNVSMLAAMAGSTIPVIVSEQIDPRRYDPGTRWALLRRLLYP